MSRHGTEGSPPFGSHPYIMDVGRRRGRLRRFLEAMDIHYVEERGWRRSVFVAHARTQADCDTVEQWFHLNFLKGQ